MSHKFTRLENKFTRLENKFTRLERWKGELPPKQQPVEKVQALEARKGNSDKFVQAVWRVIWRNKVDRLLQIVRNAAENENKTQKLDKVPPVEPLRLERVHQLLDSLEPYKAPDIAGDIDKLAATASEKGQQKVSQRGQQDTLQQSQQDASQQAQQKASQQGQQDASQQAQQKASQQGQQDASQQAQQKLSQRGQQDTLKQGQQDASQKGKKDASRPREHNQLYSIPPPKLYFEKSDSKIEENVDSDEDSPIDQGSPEHGEEKEAPHRVYKMPPFDQADFGWQATGLYGPATMLKPPEEPIDKYFNFFTAPQTEKIDMSKFPRLNRIMERSVQTSLNFNSSLYYFTS